MGTSLGYIRVSTEHQTHDAQWDALTALGIDAAHIFADKMTGARDDRPGYRALLAFLRPGDVVVVTSLDRLSRSLSGIIRTIEELRVRGIYIRTLRESIDTSTSVGRMLAGIFASLAEYERELIAERASIARKAAADRGVHAGRPRALSPEQAQAAVELRSAGWSVPRIVSHLGCSRATVYRALEASEDVA